MFYLFKQQGFTDSKESFGYSGSLVTCRYDTRIDYVYFNEAFKANWELTDYRHVTESTASDHKMVVTSFVMK